ncbi:hypothetical protein H1S01_19040 [Heliobacterium chlorum]|uniref:Uncharacterized protein n=1 Tax=Heliobacterium chlorum TaxID=2698 RepID=A0ABR7T711_HELCL|nr:hypothetical protein [Heliobacterium chlorum]MBC9786553.1 hypothetical protein [Heliobacterium chlorum]
MTYMLRQIAMETEPLDSIVISDLRQPNEYVALLKDGFTIVRVRSTDDKPACSDEALGDEFSVAELNHEIECHIGHFAVDFDITNNGRIGSLYEQIEWAVKSLKERRCEGGNLQD